MSGSRRRLLLAGTAAAFGLGLGSGSALAATAEVRQAATRAEAVYTAAPGERNDVLVSHVDDYTLRIADAGAAIVPGAGCRAVDAHTVECGNPAGSPGAPYVYTARVLAGDGDDVVRSSKAFVAGIAGPTALRGPQLAADGGAGSDLLEGSASGDELDGGGGGHDTLIGNGNNDTLTDGDATGAADADELDGGGDLDTLSYATRTAPVSVTLGSPATEGETGEGDVVNGVENAIGGSADDRLSGDERSNLLAGGAGADRIVGGGSDDRLRGGAGRDSLYGRQGNDDLRGGSGGDGLHGGSGSDGLAGGNGGDFHSCGPASDVSIQPSSADLLMPDCEGVSFHYGYRGGTSLFARAYPVAARHGYLTFSIGCPRPEVLDGECAAAYGTLRLRDSRGAPMGSGTLTRAAGRLSAATGRPALVTVRLNGHGRYRLGRRDGAGGTLTLSGHALPSNARWSVALPRVR
jgi:hypothetical protein